jgi:hypothetical protein
MNSVGDGYPMPMYNHADENENAFNMSQIGACLVHLALSGPFRFMPLSATDSLPPFPYMAHGVPCRMMS